MADADALREPGVAGVPVTPDPVRHRRRRPGDESVMSLVDHLGELRTRLFRSILAVAVGSVVGFYFVGRDPSSFLSRRRSPATTRCSSRASATRSSSRCKISIVVGIILAMPVLLYQLWAFVSPGLTPAERRTARPWIPLALVFFALGSAIACFVLPYRGPVPDQLHRRRTCSR